YPVHVLLFDQEVDVVVHRPAAAGVHREAAGKRERDVHPLEVVRHPLECLDERVLVLRYRHHRLIPRRSQGQAKEGPPSNALRGIGDPSFRYSALIVVGRSVSASTAWSTRPTSGPRSLLREMEGCGRVGASFFTLSTPVPSSTSASGSHSARSRGKRIDSSTRT